MFEAKTTARQGCIGLAYAIAYYTKCGYAVSIPLIDDQPYDLLIEIEGVVSKIQVKTTSIFVSGSFQVQLKSSRGNKTENIIKKFDTTKVDRLFALTSNGKCYDIPSSYLVGKEYSVALNRHCDPFMVNLQ